MSARLRSGERVTFTLASQHPGMHSDRFWKDATTGQTFTRSSDFPTEGVTIDISAADADFSANALRWVYAAGAGVLRLELYSDGVGVSHDFPVAANSVFKGIVRKVVRTGTTATGLVGAR